MHSSLTNFIHNFLVSALFAEDVEEHGSGNDTIVTKEIYPQIVGFRKKWSKFQFIATPNLYFEVLKKQFIYPCFLKVMDWSFIS